MDPDQFSLSAFEADCDGSACGSGRQAGEHIHPPQDGQLAVSRVTVRGGRRTGCAPAAGITRLAAS